MGVIDCSKCIHCEVCGDRYANDGNTGECSYFLEYNPSGDCISRNAVIRMFNTIDRYKADKLILQDTDEEFPKNEVFIVDDCYEQLDLIDNALPVEPEISEKQAICFLINSGWLVNHDKELREKWERPQGEWQGGELGHCTNCGHKGSASDIWNNCTGMFCPNCGAPLTEV